MTKRENILRAIHFEKPDYIPMVFSINASCWNSYPQEALCELIESHPFLFPNYHRPPLPYRPSYPNVARKDAPYIDDFGCLWKTTMDGITGTVTRHPLANWKDWSNYHFPVPAFCTGTGPINWKDEAARIQQEKQNGELTMCGLRHGHTFLQACDICGYEQVIFDMEDDEPLLYELLDRITQFNLYIIQKYLDMDVDIIIYPEDLGMQNGPMLSPRNFHTYFYPLYQRIMKPAKEKGTPIHMHSDGDIRTLLPFMLDSGVQALNLQDLVNGLGWIEKNLKGKVCIDLDIDRQKITPYGTPADLTNLIRNEVISLGAPEGGLMMIYGLYPGIPLENIKALMDAMETYAFYYS